MASSGVASARARGFELGTFVGGEPIPVLGDGLGLGGLSSAGGEGLKSAALGVAARFGGGERAGLARGLRLVALRRGVVVDDRPHQPGAGVLHLAGALGFEPVEQVELGFQAVRRGVAH